MENLSGQSIKGYELQDRIGTGGFGAVYKAYQSTVGREVAIKIILPGFANQPDFIRRFEMEAQIIARLEHPYIVPLYDYWRDPQGAYIVMRWLREGSLREALGQGAYDIPSTSRLIDQITTALAVAHRNQVIHRDLKPGNVLLDEDGNAYLADFGIAKDLDELNKKKVTQGDAVVGSLDYLSPEQARGEPVTPRTDIYSLGVMIYEMLEGEHPFPGITPVERLFKHINEPLPSLSKTDDSVRAALNEIIQKATQKDPIQRFADALELAAAFREAASIEQRPTGESVVEKLTRREQEVLRLLIAGYTNREIANELFVELSTVKWYNRNIYAKLGVHSRMQAIVRARELNLVISDDTASDLNGGSVSSIVSLPEPENPYKGLHAFQSADHRDFFGRENLTNTLLNRLSEDEPHTRFLTVVGPSGSGKSSLVKAGLIPALWRGDIPGSERWFIADMLPGSHPLDQLEVALMRIAADQSSNLHEQLARDERGLLRVADLILPDDDSQLVLIIDQFEEVFTLVEDEKSRQHFLDLIRLAVTDKRSRVRVVTTLRADFYDRPLHYPDYGELLRHRTETVLPLTAVALEQAVVGPAQRQGVSFEEGLAAHIVSEMTYQAGALPLLQYALTELFEHREGRILTHAAYQEIGGAVGALAKRADEVFSSLHQEGQELARQMFMRLVTLGEGAEDTRRRVPRSELLAISSSDRHNGVGSDLMDEIIDTYTEYRLLFIDNDPDTRAPTVEVAHEAILREWERLRKWLNESRDDIRQERIISRATEEWDAHGRDTSYLLRGARLEQMETWYETTQLILTPLEHEFTQASIEDRDRRQAEEQAQQEREARLERRARVVLRALVTVFAVAAVLSGAFGVFAVVQRNDAVDARDAEEEARQDAEIERDTQTSLLLATLAEDELESGNPERGVLLALEALGHYPFTSQAQTALIRLVENYRPIRTIIASGEDYGTQSNFWVARWSPDGSHIAGGVSAADGNNSVIIWDYDTGNVTLALDSHADLCPEGVTVQVNEIAWSPSGDRIVTASHTPNTTREDSCGIVVWDSTTGETIMTIPALEEPIWSLNWSPDGRFFIMGNNDGTVMIRDANTGNLQLEFIAHSERVNDAIFSPDGTRIMTASADGKVRIWNAETGDEELLLIGHIGIVTSAHWSPDGARIVTGGDDGLLRIWDATSGEVLLALRGHTQSITSVDWSSDGRFIASLSTNEGLTKVWDVATGTFLFEILGTSEEYGSFSPDGAFLLTGTSSAYGIVFVHDISNIRPRLLGHTDTINFADWSPDGRFIATSTPLNYRIWDAVTGEQLQSQQKGSFLNSWSSNSNRIVFATDTDGTIEVLDATSNEITAVLSIPDHFSAISASWSPDDIYVSASLWDAGGQRPIYIWNVETDEILHTLYEDCMQYLVEWSPDGSQIVSGCGFVGPEESTPARIRDVATGETVMTLESEHGWTIRAIWSPDGTKMLVTYQQDVAKIWDMETGEVLLTFAGHSGSVWGADWSPNGQYIITGDTNGVAKVWHSITGEEIASYSINGDAWTTKWSPDGTQIIIASRGSTEPIIKRVWLSTEELIDYAYECCVTRDLTLEERAQFGLSER